MAKHEKDPQSQEQLREPACAEMHSNQDEPKSPKIPCEFHLAEPPEPYKPTIRGVFKPDPSIKPELCPTRPEVGVYRRHIEPRKFGLICKLITELGSLRAACKEVGINPQAFLAECNLHPEAMDRYNAAKAHALGVVEARVFQAAVSGTPRPIVKNGEVIGEIKNPSDEMAVFYLKSHLPKIYDRAKQQQSLHLHAHSAVELSDEQLAAIVNGKPNSSE